MRGRPRKPLAILQACGSRYAEQREATEPQLPTNAPEPPDFIKGEALTEWNRVVPLLLSMRVLTEGDRATVAGYCRYWGEYVEFQRRCDLLLAKQPKGKDFPNYPQVFALRNNAFDRMTKEASKLGFSPVDRAKLVAAPEKLKKEGKGQYFDEGAA